MLKGKRILLIVAGGIAAFKSLELIRRLRERGASVRCVLTEAGARFVTPLSLQAMAPSLGPMKCTPRRRSVSTLATVAACVHMRTFIAGAASTGLSVASRTVAARSSAMPAAMRARMLAVAGATTSRSASRESWIWPISLSSVSENMSL